MVNRQLQRTPNVPLVSGEETKWVMMFGTEQVVLNVDSTEAAASSMRRGRTRINDGLGIIIGIIREFIGLDENAKRTEIGD
jgi:hypothetical protein